MNEFFKKIVDTIKNFWSKWSLVQKIIIGVIFLVVIGVLIVVISVSSQSDLKPVFSVAITDETLLNNISLSLEEGGIPHQIQNQRVYVDNEKAAKRARTILFRQNLLPKNVSPWEVFNSGSKWTVTDLENKVKVQVAITKTLEEHLLALDGIDFARVILTFPEEKLIASMQNPVKASVMLRPRPGTNINDINLIKTVENMVLFSVDGLTKENLAICDSTTNKILASNDEMLSDMNKLDLGKRQMLFKREYELEYEVKLVNALKSVFPEDRFKILNVEIDFNFDTESYEETELKPTILRADNPSTPKNEEVYVDKIDVVTEKKRVIYAGTGIHPDGPGGVEGQTVDGYKDQVGQIVEHDESHDIVQSQVSKRETKGEKAPIKIEKISAGVLLDGTWKKKRNAKGELVVNEEGGITREFTPVSSDEIKRVENALKNAIGFDFEKGYKVTVQGFQFDRDRQHEEEDEAYRRQKMIVYMVLIISGALVGFILLALVIRSIIKAREAARRRREEEEARRQALARERALRAAEEEAANMSMGIGSKNAQEEEQARQIARENPENVAELIRTWLAEE